MRKLLAVVLLAAAMVAPAFAAEKGSMEINGKLGYLINPELKAEANGQSKTIDFKGTFSLEADFFYYVDPKIAVGLGLEYVFPSEMDDSFIPSEMDSKCGNTNIFVQAKYDFAIENDIFNTIYPLVQLGYGIINISDDLSKGFDVKNGLYWAIGLGTTIKENFIVELLYAFNYGTADMIGEGPSGIDLTYKTFKFKVGYKFAI
ncbi:MAG: outer membrane beta-barrel protein [Elusimicrobia bacterium]|nr:outer membrane beta-barrel protein [Elusimicrobiota bacterium]